MSDLNQLVDELGRLETEQVNPDTVDLDRLSALEIARKINAEDRKVAEVVAGALEPIAQAAQQYAETLRNGGRVVTLGAGTSGRLGVLDAAECPPTFGTDPEQIVGLISGGYATLVLSLEGVEDNRQAAVDDLKAHGFSDKDMLIGIAASRRTPYTLAGLEYAASVGARTVFIICNRADDLPVSPDILIELPVGPEAVTGSTRMKSGTAQKMTLNMISTSAMVLLGKTYGNLMIDLQVKSDKLRARSHKILMDLLGIKIGRAEELLHNAGGSVKLALVMYKHHCTAEEAKQKLEQANGFISKIE